MIVVEKKVGTQREILEYIERKKCDDRFASTERAISGRVNRGEHFSADLVKVKRCLSISYLLF